MSAPPFKKLNEGNIRSNPVKIKRTRKLSTESRHYKKSNFVVLLVIGFITITVILSSVLFYSKRKSRDKKSAGHELESIFLKEKAKKGNEREINEKELALITAQKGKAFSLCNLLITHSSFDQIKPSLYPHQLPQNIVQLVTAIQEKSFTPVQQFIFQDKESDIHCVYLINAYSDIKPIYIKADADSAKILWEPSFIGNIYTADELANKLENGNEICIRVTLPKQLDSKYYNYDYRNSNKWLSVKLEHPDFDSSIWGYAEINSAAFHKLQTAVASAHAKLNPSNSTNAIVKIKLGNLKSWKNRQVEIVDIMSDSWYLPDNQTLESIQPKEFSPIKP